ncbi:MAG: cytochrome c biogenesis protein CcsA [Bacteroidales bacterium]|nr:cytochrome c biogenesis protein CcsA [Candidatus Sodaliphilus fimicaballi]
MGVATIIEKIQGQNYVHDTIYGSWWFIALWALLAIMALAFLVQKRVHKRCAVFLLHVSFVVMLAGALVTHLTAESGTLHLRTGKSVNTFTGKDCTMQELPFDMTLTSFEVITYPGSNAVMDYRCHITVTHDDVSEDICVSMNNIGRAADYRFYQSAYDSDLQGTQLLVAHDPYGIAITYTGYVLLLIGLLWTMFSRHTRIRQLYRSATKPLVIAALCITTAVNAYGADITPVSSEIAHEFGKVVVLYNGRLCPINTAATEFVTKLSGKPQWNGYTADEIFMSWMIYYTEWEQQRLIRVKNTEVQRILGIDSQWASVSDFYNTDHSYKLDGKANDPTIGDAARKAIRETDEKIQVVNMFYNSEMLHIFPLADPSNKAKLTWHTPGSTELPLGTPAAEFQFINHAMDYLVENVLVNNAEGAKLIIEKIKLYQKEKAGDVLPSPSMVSIEVVYNSLLSARWVVFLCLTLSLLFCMLLFANKQSNIVNTLQLTYILAQAVFLTTQFIMRWIISGHTPMSNGYETMLFMAWITIIITIVVMHRVPVMKTFGHLVSSLCMLVSMLAVGSPQITRLMPVLQSPLLSTHVALVMIAYALLALITLIAIQGLIQASLHRSPGEIERSTALSQLMLYPAVSLLAMGIFVGAVWANVSWGTYWSWDPKETWALITLMIYAVPLHKSFTPSSPVKFHAYVLASFLTVLMTYFGVNYFLTGMHSYA